METPILETDELKAEIEALKKTTTPPTITPPATTSPSTKTPNVVMVRRKAAGNGNPVNYFDKTFAEYKEGFSANGESIHMEETLWWKIPPGETWLGLETLHQLTSQQS